MQSKKSAYNFLTVLDVFLAVTAAAGGIGLLTGWNAPPTNYLEGSLFTSYTIPGLVLFGVVGGCALIAIPLMMERHPLAIPISSMAGLIVIIFQVVEVLTIGSPTGIHQVMQIFYFSLGLVMIVLGSWLWRSEHRMGKI